MEETRNQAKAAMELASSLASSSSKSPQPPPPQPEACCIWPCYVAIPHGRLDVQTSFVASSGDSCSSHLRAPAAGPASRRHADLSAASAANQSRSNAFRIDRAEPTTEAKPDGDATHGLDAHA